MLKPALVCSLFPNVPPTIYFSTRDERGELGSVAVQGESSQPIISKQWCQRRAGSWPAAAPLHPSHDETQHHCEIQGDEVK